MGWVTCLGSLGFKAVLSNNIHEEYMAENSRLPVGSLSEVWLHLSQFLIANDLPGMRITCRLVE
jgi:hypothetical protein